jgi:rhamnose utilization protein RhaD (predicted bifunctional aldolase and dehydrogenase)
VSRYCARLGADPLLVQGAGGNVSWKEDESLWVKASGTWLAEAAEKEIFLPVDLAHLKHALARGDFSVTPRVLGMSPLRPSIETLLHALLPHRVVVHLHPVEVLSHLVRDDCRSLLESRLGSAVSWALVDYHKPGAALAQAVSAALSGKHCPDLVLLKNHGVVIGGCDVEEVSGLLDWLIGRLAVAQPPSAAGKARQRAVLAIGSERYHAVDSPEVQTLAFPALFECLQQKWALYPDHVVFLGAQPFCYASATELSEELARGNKPELVFVQGEGVFAAPGFSLAKKAQLRCYHDVLVRQSPDALLTVLDAQQVAELLNWDAERYRQNVAKL